VRDRLRARGNFSHSPWCFLHWRALLAVAALHNGAAAVDHGAGAVQRGGDEPVAAALEEVIGAGAVQQVGEGAAGVLLDHAVAVQQVAGRGAADALFEPPAVLIVAEQRGRAITRELR
jgi:hypothetical protein